MRTKNSLRVITSIVVFFVGSVLCFGQEESGIFRKPFKLENGSKYGIEGMVLRFETEPIDYNNCYYVLNEEEVAFEPTRPQTNNHIWCIPVAQGENTLNIVLKDKQGNVYQAFAPSDTIFYYKDFGYWILSVGTGDKQEADQSLNLSCPMEDAQKFVEVVKDVVSGSPEIESFIINDSNATKERIMDAANKIKASIEGNKGKLNSGAVFIYLGGHGFKTNDGFCFQVKNKAGIDADFLVQDELVDMLRGFLDKIDNMNVWLFLDACYSSNMKIDLGIQKEGSKGSVIIYSAMISDGGRYKTNKRYDDMLRSGSYCDSIKNCKCLYSIVEHVGVGESSGLGEKAINGLYMVFFEKVLKERRFPIKYDELQDTLNGCYNGNLADRELAGHVREHSSKPEFPIRISSPRELTEKTLPSRYIDVAIGYNFSRQWNPQIGFSWKKWSVFADLSVNCNWTDSITHTMGKTDSVVDKLPSKRNIGIGLGLRCYPAFLHSVFSFKNYFKSDLGLSLSAQFGGIYGEKTISNVETIKHWQNYFCFTPAASLRFYSSKNTEGVKIFFNVGYSLYYACSKNKDVKALYINKEIKQPVVVDIGVSIPICSKNQKK